MQNLSTRAGIWSATHAQRAALAEDLSGLTETQWSQQSLCGRWTVEDVVAHLTASASTGPLGWFASVVGARFDFDLHNQRRMVEHRAATSAQTLERFRAIATSTESAPGPAVAWLGEIVVHSTDIRHPLGIQYDAPIEVLTAVAEFYARRDFAVRSHRTIAAVRVEATDGVFAVGDGPVVRGTTLALVMAMARRASFRSELTGPGVPLLRIS